MSSISSLRDSPSLPASGTKKLEYGKTTIHEINDFDGDLVFNGTTVKKGVDVTGSITATEANLGRLGARNSITAHKCSSLGSVHAIGAVELIECSSVLFVFTESDVTLHKTKVQREVTASKGANIKESEIGGTLTCAAEHLVIEDSKIDTIICILPEEVQSSSGGAPVTEIRENIVSIGGSFFPGGASFTSTNSPVVLVNGTFVKGFKQTWNPPEKQEAKPSQTLELRNSTVRNVIFKGKNGEVILVGASQVTGAITDGKIKA